GGILYLTFPERRREGDFLCSMRVYVLRLDGRTSLNARAVCELRTARRQPSARRRAGAGMGCSASPAKGSPSARTSLRATAVLAEATLTIQVSRETLLDSCSNYSGP